MLGQREAKPSPLGCGKQRARTQHAVFRVLPPRQRFHARDAIGCQCHLRLEQDVDLAPVDRPVQIGGKIQPRRNMALRRHPYLRRIACCCCRQRLARPR